MRHCSPMAAVRTVPAHLRRPLLVGLALHVGPRSAEVAGAASRLTAGHHRRVHRLVRRHMAGLDGLDRPNRRPAHDERRPLLPQRPRRFHSGHPSCVPARARPPATHLHSRAGRCSSPSVCSCTGRGVGHGQMTTPLRADRFPRVRCNAQGTMRRRGVRRSTGDWPKLRSRRETAHGS
jgi:hypothetical protein